MGENNGSGVAGCLCLIVLAYLVLIAIMSESSNSTAICQGQVTDSSTGSTTMIYLFPTGFSTSSNQSPDVSWASSECTSSGNPWSSCFTTTACANALAAGQTYNSSLRVGGWAVTAISFCVLASCALSMCGICNPDDNPGFYGCLGVVSSLAFVVSLMCMTIGFGVFNSRSPCTNSCLMNASTNGLITAAMVGGWVLFGLCCCASLVLQSQNDGSNGNPYQRMRGSIGGYSGFNNSNTNAVAPRQQVSYGNSADAYEFASQSVRYRLAYQLRNISPSGQTAFYDATVLGLTRMLALKLALTQQTGGRLKHRFLQVVLTDGEDNSSQSTFQDVCQLMGQVRGLGTMCRTVFIGVGTSPLVNGKLQEIARYGGQNVEFHFVNNTDIESIFERIELSVGIRRVGVAVGTDEGVYMMSSQSAHLNVGVNFFAVQFLLDISGSMSGDKWRRVCNSVNTFLNHLTDADLVSCAVFNDTARFVTGS